MKTILSILFLFVCAFAHAQYHNVEGIRVVGRSDSTTISNVGQIQFDADDDKFRFNDGTGWFSFIKEGDATDGWPLSGTGSISGSSTISFGSLALGTIYVAPDTLAFDVSAIGDHSGPRISFYLNPFPESRGHVSIGTANIVGADSVRLSFENSLNDTQAVFYDWRDNVAGGKRGIEYAEYDSTQWTGSTLVTKAYVDGKFDGIQVPEGANKTMGIATLSSGTVTVNTTAVTANSRIFLTVNGGTLTNVGTPYVSARSAGTSFTITSTNASDASDVAWLIIEPAP